MRGDRQAGRAVVVVAAVLAVLVVLIVGGGGAAAFMARDGLKAPAGDGAGHDVTVTVTRGETVDQLAGDLERQGVIRSAFWFRWYARVKGFGSQLEVGQYRINTAEGASAVLARLEQAPEIATVRVVLTEGMTARQMAGAVSASGVGISADAYMAEVARGSFDEPFTANRPPGAPLEGFLWPDTYVVRKGTTAHAMIDMQLRAFAGKAEPVLSAAGSKLTPYQLLVLASIIEREARFADDRPKVASVFMNRLAASMPLQADATVLYGAGQDGTGQAPTEDQLHADTPYNTYLHGGLPPTPISNPGLDAIKAAAQPDSTPYLFYVSDRCGHNYYSTTAAEHDQQVAQHLNTPCS